MAEEETGEPRTREGDHRLPERQALAESGRVVIKFSNDQMLLELEGDDVDLGTDLKVRRQHRLVAEFRRDAVDGWWFKSAVLRRPHPVDHHDDREDLRSTEEYGA